MIEMFFTLIKYDSFNNWSLKVFKEPKMTYFQKKDFMFLV